MILAVAERVAGTPFAIWAAGSPYAYPAANVIHVFGVILLIGGIGLVDLRMLGAFRTLPLSALSAALTPLAIAGVLILALSGSILFAADAEAVARSTTFRWKLTFLGLALLNALAFRWLFANISDPAPQLARLMALMSLILWVSVAIAGRLIAYN